MDAGATHPAVKTSRTSVTGVRVSRHPRVTLVPRLSRHGLCRGYGRQNEQSGEKPDHLVLLVKHSRTLQAPNLRYVLGRKAISYRPAITIHEEISRPQHDSIAASIA